MENFYYKYHGLIIASEIHFPELRIVNTTNIRPNSEDILIHYADVPERLEGENVVQKGMKDVTNNKFLYKIKFNKEWHGRCLIQNGNQITIELTPNANPNYIRHFLLGHIFNICLFQRGLFPFHASAIEVNNMGIGFTGASGMGKSTTATALSLRGYPLLSDDTTVIHTSKEDKIYITPSYPRVKLWEDALEVLDIKNEKVQLKGYSIKETRDKFGIIMNEQYLEKNVPLKAIYVLAKGDVNQFKMVEKKGLEKIQIIRNQSHKLEFIDGMNIQHQHFQQCTRIAQKIIVKEVIRPKNNRSQEIGAFIDFLEADFKTLF